MTTLALTLSIISILLLIALLLKALFAPKQPEPTITAKQALAEKPLTRRVLYLQ